MTERIREIGGSLEINSSAIGTGLWHECLFAKVCRKKPLRPECKSQRMNRRIWSTVISAIFLIASSACSKNRTAPQVIVEVPSGFAGNFLLEMGVRDALPLEKRGKAYVLPGPRNGKVITSTLLTNSRPSFQNSSEGAVWGYSHSVFARATEYLWAPRFNFLLAPEMSTRQNRAGRKEETLGRTFSAG
jgi:hypothetical protein